MKGLMSRRGIDRLIGLVALALMVVLPIPALAQPTQALVENWRDTDFGFNSSMFDTTSMAMPMCWAAMPLPTRRRSQRGGAALESRWWLATAAAPPSASVDSHAHET